MEMTRDFKETIAARIQNDPAFAQALLDEAIDLLVNGESELAQSILHDLVNQCPQRFFRPHCQSKKAI